MKQTTKNVFVATTCVVFLALYIVVLVQLAGRFFGFSILFAEDSSSILFIWFVMGGAVVAYQRREHLEVDLLFNALASKISPMTKSIWTTGICAAQVAYLSIFSVGLFMMARKTWQAGYGSLSDFRYGYLYVGVLVCAVTAAVIVIRQFVADTHKNKSD